MIAITDNRGHRDEAVVSVVTTSDDARARRRELGPTQGFNWLQLHQGLVNFVLSIPS